MPVECPNCHQINRDSDELCSFCGARLTIPLMPMVNVDGVLNPAEVEPAISSGSLMAISSEVEGDAASHAAGVDKVSFLEVEGGQEIFFRGAYVTRVPLKGGSLLVGRRDVMASHYPDIDLMMYRKLDPAISRRHLRIFQEDGDYHVEDLCNNNATFINDYSNKLNHERHTLRDGDRIFVSMSLAFLFKHQE